MRQQTAALWDGRLASEDCGDVGIGIDDAEAGEAEEAARKVACPLFLSLFSDPHSLLGEVSSSKAWHGTGDFVLAH